MFKKLLSITFVNGFTAILNFITNILIAKYVGLSLFGELSVFSSTIALVTIVSNIIPANYSLFRLQDDPLYDKILIQFYIFSSIAVTAICGLLCFFNILKTSFGISSVYAITALLLNYVDVKLQATNRINTYFNLLFGGSLIKLFLIVIILLVLKIENLSSIILAISASQLFIVITVVVSEWNIFTSSIISPPGIIGYYKENFSEFKGYYLYALIKKIKENILILIFNPLASSALIGLYSLFLKIASFILGLARIVEAFFSNRQNINAYKEKYLNNYWKAGITLQLFFISVGLVYLKVVAGEFYILQTLFCSIIVYPYMKFLLIRIINLSNYNNRELNYSMLAYISIIVIFFIGSKVSGYLTLNYLLITFVSTELASYAFLFIRMPKQNAILRANY